MTQFRYYKTLGAFAAVMGSSLVLWSNTTVASASSLPASATESASATPACIIYISGIEVDLGAASFRQCVSYARSSLIGKTDINSRNISSNGALYRISARLIETTMDGGKSWLPSLNNEQVPSRLGVALPTGNTVTAAVVTGATTQRTAGTSVAADQSGSLTAQSGQQRPEHPEATSVSAAATPLVPKPVETASALSEAPIQSSTAAVSVGIREASQGQQPVQSTAGAAAATIPATPETTPTVVSQGDAASRPVASDTPTAPPLLSCDYSVEGTWKKLLARSLNECVKKIKVANLTVEPRKTISAYWDKTFINISGGNAYISENGKSWTLLN